MEDLPTIWRQSALLNAACFDILLSSGHWSVKWSRGQSALCPLCLMQLSLNTCNKCASNTHHCHCNQSYNKLLQRITNYMHYSKIHFEGNYNILHQFFPNLVIKSFNHLQLIHWWWRTLNLVWVQIPFPPGLKGGYQWYPWFVWRFCRHKLHLEWGSTGQASLILGCKSD